MAINIWAVIAATVAQFVVGALWYTLLFGKLWGEIHGFDKLPKEVQDKMAKDIGPFYGLQLLVTVFSSVVLVILINNLPDFSPYYIGFLAWVGFILPAQFSAVIFGGTEGKWIFKKLAVQSAGALACTLLAVAVISLF